MTTNNMEKFDTLGLREKKHAKTKIALLRTLIEELETKPLAEIFVKEIAKKTEFSEPTFFNYFDSKPHMLVYFVQLWSLEMVSYSHEYQRKNESPINAIREIFKKISSQISTHPQMMIEIIAFQVQGFPLPLHSITDAEKWLFYPKIKNIEKLQGKGLESILPPLLVQANEAGELEPNLDLDLIFLILSSLFYGSAALLLKRDPGRFSTLLNQQLEVVFESILV